jgi:cell wall-associated NlpC family hydrolase
MIEPCAVIAQAREWLGVPFLHQGRSRNGCDCLGFIAACLAELGSAALLEHLPRAYGRMPQKLLIDGLEELSREIPLQPAAIVTIKFPRTEFPSHAAIFTGDTLIHCFESERKVVEHGYREPWIRRTASIWAAPLVAYQ